MNMKRILLIIGSIMLTCSLAYADLDYNLVDSNEDGSKDVIEFTRTTVTTLSIVEAEEKLDKQKRVVSKLKRKIQSNKAKIQIFNNVLTEVLSELDVQNAILQEYLIINEEVELIVELEDNS